MENQTLGWHSSPCICRCCSSVGCYKDLTGEYFWLGKREVYSEMLLDVFNITLSNLTENSRERLICEVCITRLRAAANFKNQVVESEKKFLGHINSPEQQNAVVEFKAEEVKEEIIEPYEQKENEDDDFSSMDDESLATLKLEPIKTESHTRKSPRTKKNRQQKKNVSEEEPTSSNKINKGSTIVPKLLESLRNDMHLKENTLKILKNSNVCLFQWQRNRCKCLLCKETYVDIKGLREHVRREHTYGQLERMVVRKNSVHYKADVCSLTCKICSGNFKTIDVFIQHLTSHKITFAGAKNLLIPYKLDDNFNCQLCSDAFNDFHKLNIHMNKHYQNHICEDCGMGFKSKANLRAHFKRHYTKTFNCAKCDLNFKNCYEKERHMFLVHKNLAKRVCQYCPERFNGHYSRLVHMIRTHGMQKPEFKCGSCDKVFLRQFLLNVHIRKAHMKEKNHECGVCGIKFFQRCDLNDHTTTHTGEKRFTCGVCSKAYARKSSLRDHIKIHNIV